MSKKIRYYIFLFFLAAILGWCGEIVFNLIVNDKLVNPGTLSLCWCPIYGVAAVIIDLVVKKENKVWKNALIIGAISTIDEYIAAYISETYFNNRLWDYSNFILNFQGRICLPIILIFIAFGLLSVYVIIPLTKKIYKKYYKVIDIASSVTLVVFILNIVYDAFIGKTL